MGYPIVLVPGIARFDFLREHWLQKLKFFLSDRTLQGDRTHYFRRIRPYLQAHGFTVEHTNTGFAEEIGIRADRLAAAILLICENYHTDKVHIIGQSMGGLDARYTAVNIPNISDKIASITTIGTPHHGTPFANFVMSLGAEELIKLAHQYSCLDFRGFLAITTDAMATFNENHNVDEAENNITYYTYTAHQKKRKIFTPLQTSWQYIHEREGANDGLVSASSQTWQTELAGNQGKRKTIHQRQFSIEADHLNQIGWWDINEWQKIQFWQLGILRQRYAYEQQIRDTYLKIAQETASIE